MMRMLIMIITPVAIVSYTLGPMPRAKEVSSTQTPFCQQRSISLSRGRYRYGTKSSVIRMSLGNEGSDNSSQRGIVAAIGIIAQPVVWTSLYFVATTGAGLPAGPFGLLGALEGISYLVILAFVGVSLYRKVATDSGADDQSGSIGDLMGAAESLSYVSLIAGLLTLASLVAEQGCIPNAKPILDYSDYLPVCDTAPGLFGE